MIKQEDHLKRNDVGSGFVLKLLFRSSLHLFISSYSLNVVIVFISHNFFYAFAIPQKTSCISMHSRLLLEVNSPFLN
ncbi:unnamed protein product [Phytomonas sp. EM1]|nr:unnamed protein product [Phytomonas sp. EM1]|eukprot:CCW64471.1 unnamed protein product [Phytomonas sp. isolate EM1]